MDDPVMHDNAMDYDGTDCGPNNGDFEDDGYDEEDTDEEFQPRGRGRGFRFGPPRNWAGGPPRFRGRFPGGPPFRGRGPPPPLFGRGVPPRNGPPGFNGPPNWGPPGMMGPPFGGPGGPGMMGPPGMGPPPHMMGGPGAGFGGQNMGPSNNMGLDMNAEIWVETKTGEGKSYFYNARTRETTWTKPDGPNIKVISQEQVEAMAQAAAASGAIPGTSTAAQAAQAQASISNKQEDPGADKGGSQGADQQQMVVGGGGMPPQGSQAVSGIGNNPNPMQPPPNMMQGPPPGMPPHFPGPAGPFTGTPFGMPPPGFHQGFPGAGWPPGGPPTAPWMPPPMQQQLAAAVDEAAVMSQIDPEIVAKATEWTEHKAPDGRSYYYHAKKAESVWEKPQPMKDLETARLAAAQGISTRPVQEPSSLESMQAAAASATGKPSPGQIQASNGDMADDMDAENEMEKQKKREEEALKRKKEEEEKAKEAKAQDKSRPISSTPVPGTPWCVVWTGDGRVFFYNPSSRTSVWERPEDLAGRSDVDKMLQTPPEVLVPHPNNAINIKNVGIIGKGKRAGSESSDSDGNDAGTPAKKAKKDIATPNATPASNGPQKPEKKTIDIGKEAAIEAEVRAAKERAVVPLDIRIRSFKEMLAEKEVSAFSTWEKELHKIVFDPRYLLLTSKERKQVFEKYVKERAEEERREKRNKLRERKDAFKKLLSEAHLHGKSSFSDFAQKYAKDERFKNVEKMRERESLFNEYLIEVRKREKEEKLLRREQVKKDFHALLREHSDVDRHSRWSDVKKKVDADARYKAVESSGQREDWFREYCKILKDEKRKAKEKEREHKKDAKDKHSKSAKKDKDKPDGEKNANDESVISEDDPTTKTEKEDGTEMDTSEKPNTGEEGAEKAEGEEEARDEDQEPEVNSDDERALEQKEKEKQARAEVSLREREKEVQRTLATHLRDRDKEREQHKRDEAIQHFNALLADLVRNADLAWREAKRQLRKDHRWDLAELLQREEKEKLFNEHIDQLLRKKREKFRELLDETTEVTLTSTWKDIKKIIKEDPRYTKFASSERCEREFKDYIKDKLIAAKADFKELLQETKLITHKSLTTLRENENHMSEIQEILKNDRRYLVLDYIPQERTQLILNYLEELDKRGPPPPPTASEPTRRPMK